MGNVTLKAFLFQQAKLIEHENINVSILHAIELWKQECLVILGGCGQASGHNTAQTHPVSVVTSSHTHVHTERQTLHAWSQADRAAGYLNLKTLDCKKRMRKFAITFISYNVIILFTH